MQPDLSSWDELPSHLGPIPPVNSVHAVDSLRLLHLAKIVRLTRDFDKNIPGLKFAYDLMLRDGYKMSEALAELDQMASVYRYGIHGMPLSLKKLHVRYQNSYAILLYIALSLHRGLDRVGALGPSKHADLENLTLESIKISDASTQYRPLGASSVPFSLAMAFVMSDDPVLLARMDVMLGDWEGDFEATRWRDLAHDTRDRRYEPGWLYLTHSKF
jgi:hypothetical protein